MYHLDPGLAEGDALGAAIGWVWLDHEQAAFVKSLHDAREVGGIASDPFGQFPDRASFGRRPEQDRLCAGEAEMIRHGVRKGVILLAVILAPCALLGYAAFAAAPVPVMLSGANGVRP